MPAIPAACVHPDIYRLLGRRYIPRSRRSGYSWFRSGDQALVCIYMLVTCILCIFNAVSNRMSASKILFFPLKAGGWDYIRTGLQPPETSEDPEIGMIPK